MAPEILTSDSHFLSPPLPWFFFFFLLNFPQQYLAIPGFPPQWGAIPSGTTSQFLSGLLFHKPALPTYGGVSLTCTAFSTSYLVSAYFPAFPCSN